MEIKSQPRLPKFIYRSMLSLGSFSNFFQHLFRFNFHKSGSRTLFSFFQTSSNFYGKWFSTSVCGNLLSAILSTLASSISKHPKSSSAAFPGVPLRLLEVLQLFFGFFGTLWDLRKTLAMVLRSSYEGTCIATVLLPVSSFLC